MVLTIVIHDSVTCPRNKLMMEFSDAVVGTKKWIWSHKGMGGGHPNYSSPPKCAQMWLK